MLKRLQLNNFKSWERADLAFSRITGLFGTNSSGKSSLLQFVLLLKQTKEATDRAVSLDLNGQYANLGTFHDIIFRHEDERKINWILEFDRASELVLNDPSSKRTNSIAKSKDIEVQGRVEASSQGPASRYLSYRVGPSQRFTLSPRKSDDTAFGLRAEGSGFRFIRTPGRAWQLPGPIKSYAFPDQARTYFQNASFLADLEKAYEDQIDEIFYLGPLRDYPKREYTWARTRPRDVGLRGEKVIDAILAATAAGEDRNLRPKARLKTFQEMIAFWLVEMGLIEKFRVEELAPGSNYWQARVTVNQGGAEALLTDVGFGISQVLPIVALLYYVPEKATVILEQPEIHLHPLAQAHLADLMINVAKHRNIQIFFESHSEHLLLRFQRRIAEGELSSDQVNFYFCDIDAGKSRLKKLEIDFLGNIQNWPQNFMGDALGETLAAERARLKRMQAP